MALAVLYLMVPATLAERHAYSEITRPSTGEFLKATIAVPISGALLGSLVAFVITDVLGVSRSPARLLIELLMIGIVFGLLVPPVTALVLPINMFLVDMTTRSNEFMVTVDHLLVAIFSTPRLLFIYWTQSLHIGIVSGGLVSFVSFLAMFTIRGGSATTVDLRPAALSLCFAAILLALLIAGPFGFYEHLVRQLAGK